MSRRSRGGDLHADMEEYGDIHTDDVVYGRNSSGDKERFIRCRKCGFVMNKNRHSKGWGAGNTFAVTVVL
jgi:hypothetical protein